MIRAAIDPGSRWIAVTVTEDLGPSQPIRFVDAFPFEVGHEVTYDPPLVKVKSRRAIDGVPMEGPLETYLVTRGRELTEAESSAAATRIVAYLLGHGVDEVATEHVRHMYGANAGAGTGLLKSAGVYVRIVDRLEQFGIAVQYVPASTWRARLNPLVKDVLRAQGLPAKGVLIGRNTGAVLDPVFVAHLAGWPGASRWTADEAGHIRDSTGLALACGLPALETSRKASAGPRKPRGRAATKRSPRSTRARGEMLPAKAEAYRVTDRAYDARTRLADLATARVAAGCKCKLPGAPTTGRHKAWCPAHKGAPRVESTCPRCSRLYAVHPRRDVCPA